jgi:hypothetical protein
VPEGIVPVVAHGPELAHRMSQSPSSTRPPEFATVPSGVLLLKYVAVIAGAAAATFSRRDP